VLDGDGERTHPGGRDLVVTTWRALLTMRHRVRLPAGSHEASALESAEDRVDGAAGQAGRIHDIEAIPDAGRDSLEDSDGGG
jgi:hypothetical protein